MPRPEFTLRSLLVAMLVVATFFGGMAVQRQLNKPSPTRSLWFDDDRRVHITETMTMPDGTTWERQHLANDEPEPD
jgi:hypothetical protein